MSSDRTILETTLGKLLGFEDGASDVLEHLLAIESRDDLFEYLMQLLGDSGTPELLEFVNNMGKYNHGEPLTLTFPSEHQGSNVSVLGKDSKPGPAVAATAPNQSPNPAPTSSQQSSDQAVVESRRNQKQNKSRVPPPKKKQQSQDQAQHKARPISKGPETGKNSASEVASSNNSKAEELSETIEKLRPTRGGAKRVCGCYGTFHKPLTNCLYCGRISCIEEGYDFCPFCGYMVDDVYDGQDHSNDPGWQQKERLLRFDREFARRTEVFDDQADYQGPSTWMTDDERAHAEKNEQKQLEALKRPKQVLNLAL